MADDADGSAAVAIAKRGWIQAIITRRCLSEKQAKALHKRACFAAQANYDASHYDEFVDEVAQALGPLGLEIRRSVDEISRKSVVALVNTKGDEIAQIASSYSPHELAYIKRIVEVIMTAPDEAYCVTSLVALRECASLKPAMTKRAGEELLGNLVRHGWLRRSASGKYYSLGVRSILELESYLKNEFEEYVLECAICMDIVTHGVACSKPSCSARLHKHCEARIVSGTKKCPKCESPWDPAPVGEESVGSGRKPARRRRRANSDSSGGDEEEDEGETDEQEGARARTKPGLKRPRRDRDEDEEEDEGEDANENGEDDDDGDDVETPPPRPTKSADSKRASRRSKGTGERSAGGRRIAGNFVMDEASDSGDAEEAEEDEDEN